MTEKHNWFVYIEGSDRGHPIGYGRLLTDLTEEEAKIKASKFLENDLRHDEGCVGHGFESVMNDETYAPDKLDDIQNKTYLIKVSSAEHIPVMPIVEKFKMEIKESIEKERQRKLKKQLQKIESEKRLYERLKKKYENNVEN